MNWDKKNNLKINVIYKCDVQTELTYNGYDRK